MTLRIGRKAFIGLGKETTPGVPVPPTVYIPWTDQTLMERHTPIADIAAKGTRDAERGSVSGKAWGEGSVTVNLDGSNVGYLFLMLFGSVSSATAAGSVKDHTFTKNDSNTPQTYSMVLDRGVDQNLFVYATAKSGELKFTDDLATLKVDFLSQDPVTSTSGTLSTASGIIYAWKDANVRFGTTISGALSSTATQVSELTLTIDNGSQPSWRSGVRQPASIDHGPFKMSGSFKLFFEDRTQLDKYIAATKQSMVLQFTGRGIGSSLNESISIYLPSIRLDETSVETPIDDFMMVTVSFVAEFDGTAGLATAGWAVVRNTTASY